MSINKVDFFRERRSQGLLFNSQQSNYYDEIIIDSEDDEIIIDPGDDGSIGNEFIGNKISIGRHGEAVGTDEGNQFVLNHNVLFDITDFKQQAGLPLYPSGNDLNLSSSDGKFKGGKGDDFYNVSKGQNIVVTDTGGKNILYFGEGLRKEDMRFVGGDGYYLIKFKNSRTQVQVISLTGKDLKESSISEVISEIRFSDGSVVKQDDFSLIAGHFGASYIYNITRGQEFVMNELFRDGRVQSHEKEHLVLNKDYKILDVTTNNGNPIPSWMRFDANTGIVRGKSPIMNWQSQYTLTFQVQDIKTGKVSLIDRFVEFNYLKSNTAPRVNTNVLDKEINVNKGTNFSYQFDQSSFFDLESNPLSYRVVMQDGSKLPAGVIFDAATMTLKGNIENSEIGKDNLSLKIVAVDSHGASSEFRFTMNFTKDGTGGDTQDNQAPVANGNLATQQINLGKDWFFELPKGSFTDDDLIYGDVLTYSLLGEKTPKWLTIDAKTGKLSGTPEKEGDYEVVIMAKDKSGESATHTFTIKVVNDLETPSTPAPIPMPGNKITFAENYILGFGSSGDDTIIANDKGMFIYSGTGNDTIFGGKGNDSIYGVTGSNTIIGGKGNDYISGGTGNNRYIFNKGDGKDILSTSKYFGILSTDVIQFNDVNSSDVNLRRENNNLIIEYGDDDSIQVRDFFHSSQKHIIDSIKFVDKSLSAKEITTLVSNNIPQGSGDIHIYNLSNEQQTLSLKNSIASFGLSDEKGFSSESIGQRNSIEALSNFTVISNSIMRN